jgi:hypothetical protein
MNYRQIIEESWEFAQSHKSIMLMYAFLPAVINAIFSIGFIVYQFYSVKYSPNLGLEAEGLAMTFFHKAQTFIEQSPEMMLPIGLVLVSYLLAYTFIPTLSKGAIVQLAARIRNKQNPKLLAGVGYGLRSFLPLFGFNLFLNIFSLTTIFGYFMMVFRNFSLETTKLFLPIFIVLFIVGLIMSFLFAFAENYIVIDDKSVDNSILESSKLVLEHWTETIFVLVLMGLIALRILLNMVLVFLIPILISLAISFFATINLASFSFLIIATILIFALYIIGYLGGTFSLFANAVWTFTFLELTSRKNKSPRSVAS